MLFLLQFLLSLKEFVTKTLFFLLKLLTLLLVATLVLGHNLFSPVCRISISIFLVLNVDDLNMMASYTVEENYANHQAVILL